MEKRTAASAEILIVDDEESVRNLLRDILSDEFDCTLAASAEEALALFTARRFGLVVSDINMGGMTGVEMIPRIRTLSPDTVVMMISGDMTIDSAIDAMRQGAFDYVRKPFEIDHVLVSVRRAVTHHQLLVSKREYEEDLERLVQERTAQLEFLTLHDRVTSLPNRLLIEDRLGRLILRNQPGESVAAVLVSLDRMNQIRGTLGAQAADELMLRAAERIAAVAGERTVGRIEGDVFVILVPRTTPEDLVSLAGRFIETLTAAFTIDAREMFLRPGLGISLCPGDGKRPDELLRNAGLALSHSRDASSAVARFYEAGVNEFAVERLALENDLRRAVDRDELVVHYQPKVETLSGRITGAEALIRWRHPQRGLVSPGDFIPAAEAIGIIPEIGKWVLRKACADVAGCVYDGLSIAVNVSRQQLQEPGLASIVASAVDAAGLSPERLHLEVTETSVMQNSAVSIAELVALRAMGVRISIDDFGTGYSSLNALKDLPVDVLKVDRSFISDIAENERDAAFVKTIIDLARNLGLSVVAEGVETNEQLSLLNRLGCDEWQGFLFSRPVPLPEFLETLARNTPSS